MSDREALEQQALDTVSPENFYDLGNDIDVMSDDDLRAIIACGGDLSKEMALINEGMGLTE